jgi:hypothetical protein
MSTTGETKNSAGVVATGGIKNPARFNTNERSSFPNGDIQNKYLYVYVSARE